MDNYLEMEVAGESSGKCPECNIKFSVARLKTVKSSFVKLKQEKGAKRQLQENDTRRTRGRAKRKEMILEWEGLGETIEKGSSDLIDDIKGEKLVEEKEDNIYTEDNAFEGTVL